MFQRDRRRDDGDRGSVMVEFALVVPLLVALAMGILEYGMVFRTSNTIDRAAAAGGRIGSSMGPGQMADYEVLQAVNSVLSSNAGLELTKVIVYNSTTPDGDPPENCTALSTGGVAGLCNVYGPTQVAVSNPAVGFPPSATPGCVPARWDSSWCPTSRNNDPQAGDVTYLGVYVEAEMSSYTGLYFNEMSLAGNAVYRLEPPSLTTPGAD